MREILFHGKRLDNGQWVEAVSILSTSYGAAKEMYIAAKVGMELAVDSDGNLHAMTAGPHIAYYRVDPNTVGQFTGLTDKNGKKIFEGDICRFREWSKGEMCWVGKVHWEHQQFMIIGGPNKECETMFELCMSRFIPENIEVIGNIHDNPELLDQ